METKRQAFPGDALGPATSFSAGNGTYLRNGMVVSSLAGVVVEDNLVSPARPELHVVVKTKASDYVVRIGDTVLCKVTRVNYNQAFVDILVVGDLPLPFPVKAVVRREDIRDKEIDKVVVQEFFKPGDIVRAAVISLGDTKVFLLSIAKAGLGVIVPKVINETAIP